MVSHRFGARPPQEDPDHNAVELAAVRADDALINAIGGAERDADLDLDLEPDEVVRLEAVLRTWRQDVDAQPLPELVDLEQAAEVVAASGRDQSPVRRRRGLALVIAAAALVVAVAALGFAVHAATPGDPLWGISEVVFSQHAASVQKAEQAATQLDQANAALAAGQPSQAQTMLSQAGAQLPEIRDQDGAADLQARHAQLAAQLRGGPPHPAPAATPNGLAGHPSNKTAGSSTPSRTTSAPSPQHGHPATRPTPATTSTTTTSTTTAPPTPCRSHGPTATRPATARCTP
ncbi:hypothetical protein [Actinomycetospora cinnamomea]|uniref:Anti-sigma-D factor RsdA-like protein n=1 Tax=Actinomycetospora cinnamomea TaxID=663609 RepID=A0A2U1E8T3_9PSEU|nr:hypothetical protein [Actinomycetospora cinnamomea]PVY96353.1 hypothetical protein C8D89_1303 [Actinomycetospora cinnamomea]